MKLTFALISAAAISVAPAIALAQPNSPARPPEPGLISPHHETGQPSVECGEEEALGSPGHASDAPGSAFNEEGTGHEHYAGEQDQNSKNTASVSQYDVACLHAPE